MQLAGRFVYRVLNRTVAGLPLSCKDADCHGASERIMLKANVIDRAEDWRWGSLWGASAMHRCFAHNNHKMRNTHPSQSGGTIERGQIEPKREIPRWSLMPCPNESRRSPV